MQCPLSDPQPVGLRTRGWYAACAVVLLVLLAVLTLRLWFAPPRPYVHVCQRYRDDDDDDEEEEENVDDDDDNDAWNRPWASPRPRGRGVRGTPEYLTPGPGPGPGPNTQRSAQRAPAARHTLRAPPVDPSRVSRRRWSTPPDRSGPPR